MKITFTLAAVFAVLLEVNSQCLTTNDNKPMSPQGKKGLYTGQQNFSLALLQTINSMNREGNLFFSPYSTYHALLLAYFISANDTEKALKKTLKLDENQEKNDIFGAYKFDKFATMHRTSNASYEFTNANRMYVERAVNIRDCVNAIFSDELQLTDFRSNPDVARNNINKWVETQTHDMIRDLLPSGSIDASTNLVLVNAAYFKGIWENKFDPAQTKPDLFYINPSKQTFVDMMHVEGAFNHENSEALMAHILELPYQGNDISMYIFLPPFVKEDGVATILKRLTVETFRDIVDGNTLQPRTVQVSLPKFSMEHTIEMVPLLNKLTVTNCNVSEIFLCLHQFKITVMAIDTLCTIMRSILNPFNILIVPIEIHPSRIYRFYSKTRKSQKSTKGRAKEVKSVIRMNPRVLKSTPAPHLELQPKYAEPYKHDHRFKTEISWGDQVHESQTAPPKISTYLTPCSSFQNKRSYCSSCNFQQTRSYSSNSTIGRLITSTNSTGLLLNKYKGSYNSVPNIRFYSTSGYKIDPTTKKILDSWIENSEIDIRIDNLLFKHYGTMPPEEEKAKKEEEEGDTPLCDPAKNPKSKGYDTQTAVKGKVNEELRGVLKEWIDRSKDNVRVDNIMFAAIRKKDEEGN